MEIELRAVLLIAGLLILCIVGFDMYRRRPIRLAEFAIDVENADLEPAGDMNDYHAESNYVEDLEASRHPARSRGSDVDPGSINDLDLYGLDLDESQLIETQVINDHYDEPVTVPKTPSKKFVALSVMARDREGFNGKELLTALQNAQLQYGENDIFHRYENNSSQGQILFSVANAVEPGYFDIDLLPQQTVHGLTFFVVADNLINPASALDQMVRAAKQVAFALNGEMFDQYRQPLTLNTIEQYRVLISKR